jgi:hypothetical protein
MKPASSPVQNCELMAATPCSDRRVRSTHRGYRYNEFSPNTAGSHYVCANAASTSNVSPDAKDASSESSQAIALAISIG